MIQVQKDFGHLTYVCGRRGIINNPAQFVLAIGANFMFHVQDDGRQGSLLLGGRGEFS